MKSSSQTRSEIELSLPIIGRKERIQLPELSLQLTAKVDNGARSSALHARDIETLWVEEKEMVRFKVEPYMVSDRTNYIVAKLLERRMVKSSNGQTEIRPVIKSTCRIGNENFEIELTLTNRGMMGCAMLLGRRAISNRFLVHPGKSFLLTES